MVLWLVVGMAFFNEPISEVARRLNICAEGLANDALLADSALSQARQRLGKQPLSGCCSNSAPMWGAGNVILKTIGTVYRSLPSMGPCSEPRICLNSEHISARVTPQPTGRHPTRCCGWSRS